MIFNQLNNIRHTFKAARVLKFVYIIIILSLLIGWIEASIVFIVDTFISDFKSLNNNNYLFIILISLILIRIIFTIINIASTFYLYRKYTIYAFKRQLLYPKFKSDNDNKNINQSEFTQSILIGIRHLANLIPSISFIVSSGIFLIFLLVKIMSLPEGKIGAILIFLSAIIYSFVILSSSYFIKRLSERIKKYGETLIDQLTIAGELKEWAKSSKEGYEKYTNLFSDNQIKMRNTQGLQNFVSLVPSLLLESIYYIIIGITFIGYPSNNNDIINQLIPTFKLLIISSPRIFSIINKFSQSANLISNGLPYVNTLISNLILINETKEKNHAKIAKDSSIKNQDQIILKLNNKIITSFSIYENTIITLKGKSGSGKSTLISDVIYGRNCLFYSSKYYSLFKQGKLYCFIGPRVQLLELSVFKNIFLDNQINYKLLKRFEKAYDICGLKNILKARGMINSDPIKAFKLIDALTLSSGEKQRVSIARSIIYGGPVLLFDEASSNLPINDHQKILKSLITSNLFIAFIICSHNESKFLENNKDLNIKEIFLKEKIKD